MSKTLKNNRNLQMQNTWQHNGYLTLPGVRCQSIRELHKNIYVVREVHKNKKNLIEKTRNVYLFLLACLFLISDKKLGCKQGIIEIQEWKLLQRNLAKLSCYGRKARKLSKCFFVCLNNGKKIQQLFAFTLNGITASVRRVSSITVVLNAKLSDWLRRAWTWKDVFC